MFKRTEKLRIIIRPSVLVWSDISVIPCEQIDRSCAMVVAHKIFESFLYGTRRRSHLTSIPSVARVHSNNLRQSLYSCFHCREQEDIHLVRWKFRRAL